jgi:hypothetical protein
LEEKIAAPVLKSDNMAEGIRCSDHAITFIRKKLVLTSPTGGVRSIGRVRWQTKAMEFLYDAICHNMEVFIVLFTILH